MNEEKLKLVTKIEWYGKNKKIFSNEQQAFSSLIRYEYTDEQGNLERYVIHKILGDVVELFKVV